MAQKKGALSVLFQHWIDKLSLWQSAPYDGLWMCIVEVYTYPQQDPEALQVHREVSALPSP